MAADPVSILSVKHPESAKDIDKISQKWYKRTKNFTNPWPKGGSFDLLLNEVMEQRILDYKAKQNNKNRKEKRQKELQILKLFRTEGDNFRGNLKAMMTSLTEKQGELNLPGKQTDTKHLVNQEPRQGIYPCLQGDLHINANFDIQRDGMEEYAPLLRLTGSTFSQDSEEGNELPSPQPLRSPVHCSTAIKKPEVRDCYAGIKTQNPEAVKDQFWQTLQNNDPNPNREVKRTIINELEKEIDKCHTTFVEPKQPDNKEQQVTTKTKQKDFNLNYRPNCHSPTPGTSTAQPTHQNPTGAATDTEVNTQKQHDLRDREKIKKPIRFPDGAMCPILVKGTNINYVPWQMLDLNGLLARLPNIHEGATRWIRAFEEQTTGLMLAMGDIKAILARVMGTTAMNNMLNEGDLCFATDPDNDGVTFNPYRNRVWELLRKQYPTNVDPSVLKGEGIAEGENPAAYVERQLKRWHEETESDPNENAVMRTLFRSALMAALPERVKERLEKTVGIHSMSHIMFRENVCHAIGIHRKELLKAQENERNAQRKLTQLHIAELQNKAKAKPAIGLETEGQTPQMVMTPQPPNPPQIPPPVINVFPNRRGGRGMGQRRPFYRRTWSEGQRGGPTRPHGDCCYACNRPGHLARDCEYAPVAPEWNGRGRARQRGNFRGPVNHFVNSR